MGSLFLRQTAMHFAEECPDPRQPKLEADVLDQFLAFLRGGRGPARPRTRPNEAWPMDLRPAEAAMFEPHAEAFMQEPKRRRREAAGGVRERERRTGYLAV